MIKNLFFEGSGCNTVPRDAVALLKEIPADLPYPDWFRVAAALKNSGVGFEVFDQWSQTAPDKYDADVCKRVWTDVGADDKPEITLRTLHFIADRYNGTIVPAPFEMLPQPKTAQEQAMQMDKFLELMFRSGESFELVTESAVNDKGKRYPKRSAACINTLGNDDSNDSSEEFIEFVQRHTNGAWISLNPVRSEIKGQAPSDAEVTDYRHALIEADELSKEEQWQKLRKLNLPILAVVWSGGKSLHAIVKIDAGNDRELYKKRVEFLHDYLKEKGFPADRANKNPSRLTRLPGVRRGNDMQYLVASEFGSKDWDTFERMFLNKTDRRAETSPINGQLGGRPTIPVTDYAEAFLAENSTKGVPQLRYWNREWWKYDHHWISVNEDDLNNQVTRFLQQHKVQRAYRISTAFVNDVVLNIRGLCCLSGITMPCWLPDGSDASDTLCFSNSLLSVQELIAGNEQTLQSHTPEYFGLDNVDYAYDPDADCPMWNEYLATTFDDDDSRAALQMMFGYILSGKTNKNVGFFLVGRGGDGKSVAAHILRKLIGENQSCCLPFANLGDRFSSYLLTEHKLNLVEEMPVSAEIRNISDAEKADLKHDLEAELLGIFNWAICGARMLEMHTRFPIPPASVEYLAKHRLACDHETAFLSEAVVADPEGISSKHLLYQQYRSWIESRGYKPVGSSRFNAAVKAAFPDVREERQRSPIDRLIWSGISLLNMA